MKTSKQLMIYSVILLSFNLISTLAWADEDPTPTPIDHTGKYASWDISVTPDPIGICSFSCKDGFVGVIDDLLTAKDCNKASISGCDTYSVDLSQFTPGSSLTKEDAETIVQKLFTTVGSQIQPPNDDDSDQAAERAFTLGRYPIHFHMSGSR